MLRQIDRRRIHLFHTAFPGRERPNRPVFAPGDCAALGSPSTDAGMGSATTGLCFALNWRTSNINKKNDKIKMILRLPRMEPPIDGSRVECPDNPDMRLR
jgi:hypothetical protein